MTLTFESKDKILWSDHSNKTSLPVLSHGTICFFMVQSFLLLHLATFGSERVKFQYPCGEIMLSIRLYWNQV